MKLSIVIVSYNEKNYLPTAIDSCLNQNFTQDYEIIIGDDGSNDGSLEVIEDYAKRYPKQIKYFVMDREPGIKPVPSFRVSNIFFRAFKETKGEYIMCLSGDDYFSDMNKFDRQISFLDKHPKYASCYTGFKMVWDDGDEKPIEYRRHVSNKLFWGGDYSHISCFAFRRTAFDYLLPRFCDDTGLIFSIFKAGKSYAIKDIMFAYRQRPKSIMHEADQLELAIIELMLFQDVLKVGGFYKSSLSRFSRPLKYVYEHQDELDNPKYAKYLESGMINPDKKIVRKANYYGVMNRRARKINLLVSRFL